MIRVRDEFWATLAIPLVFCGIAFIGIGLLPRIGFAPGVTYPEAVTASGLLVLLGGIWFFIRRGEWVITISTRTVEVRDPFRRRSITFSEIVNIGLLASPDDPIMMTLPISNSDRYDVVLSLRDGSRLTVRLASSWEEARAEAQQIASAIGVALEMPS